jgi:hypothetical protein
MSNRGTALMATLIIIMILLPLGAYVVLQCRTDLMIERNFGAEIEAFYAAEAGLEHALAEIDPGQAFDDVLAGPDRIAGTADDGSFPFREGPPGAFPFPPLGYDVRVTAAGHNVLSIVSRGTGRYGATKVVTALVVPLAFTPAALYSQGDIRRLDLGGGQLLLSGLDYPSSDSPASPTGTAAPVPALASPNADAEQDLRRRLPEENLAGRLVGSGDTPSIATSSAINVQTYADRFAAQPACVHLSALGDTAVLGTPGTPQISLVEGDAVISESDQLSGSGVLVVRGTLHVTGTLKFTGLIIALNGILLELSGKATITGALWQGPTMDDRLQLRSSGAIVYSSRALAAADAAFPGLLPHAAVVSGWEEEL